LTFESQNIEKDIECLRSNYTLSKSSSKKMNLLS